MKKIQKIIPVLLTVFLFLSCTDDFINIPPKSEVTVENFYKTENDLEQAVTAAYAALQSDNQYRLNFLYLMEVRSDNSYYEDITQTNVSDFDFFREATNNTVLDNTWKTCYIGIQRCNIVLNRIDAIAMDENKKTIRKGEVKFIRALTYFNMVRMWGELPIVLEEIDNPFNSYSHTRQPVTEVYEAIINDLEEAIEALPVNQNEIGRVTKGAALTLLGKVYLTREDWGNAIVTLKQVESIGYQILPNYAAVFDAENENNQESIFEIQFASGFDGEGSLFMRAHTPDGNTTLLSGVTAGVGFNIPTQDLFDAYSDSDLRKSVSVSQLPSPDGRFYTKKFNAIPSIPNDEDNNFMVLRYADVLLMLAEALNEQGYIPNGEAFGYLNTIRQRAGLSVLTDMNLTNQELFREAVLKERRLEFAFENQRWFDLVRTRKAVEVMSEYVEIRGPLLVGSKHFLYAIPQAQIDIMNNPNFKQNPGY